MCSNCRLTYKPQTIQVNYTWWRERRHITHQGLNMHYDCQLHAASWAKESLSLPPAEPFLLKEQHHSTHYGGSGWGRHSHPIKVVEILPVMHPGVLYQHVACASLQEVHTEKKERGRGQTELKAAVLYLLDILFKSNIHLLLRLWAL